MAQWPKADHFESDGAVKTLLPRAIHHTLAATTDYLQQFIVAKVARTSLPRSRRFSLSSVLLARHHARPGSTTPATGFVREQIKSGLKQAGGTETFGCVSKNFCSALSTNPRCAAHDGRVACALPIMYCADFWHTLRSQHSDQMAQLIFDIAGNGDSVTDFFAQQELITLAKPMEGLPECIIGHAQLRCDLRCVTALPVRLAAIVSANQITRHYRLCSIRPLVDLRPAP